METLASALIVTLTEPTLAETLGSIATTLPFTPSPAVAPVPTCPEGTTFASASVEMLPKELVLDTPDNVKLASASKVIAPIIAMVNPNQIVDATYKQAQIPADQIRKEENIRRAVEEMREHLQREKMAEQKRKEVEAELRIMTEKLTRQIRDMEDAAKKNKFDLFHKERQVLNKLNPFKTGTDD
jgi:hypothetical protein